MFLSRCCSYLFAIAWGGAVAAQSQVSFDAVENRSFASENAILDTSIPFSIGAREAQQALRGSFGWPNFQEGLVEGVYFRFDPDGYARFAPTPRLDMDVFEVICRPRTYSCAARKEGFEMFLTDRGQIQIKLENVTAGDTLHVVEGVSEIQIPERVLQPLDMQLEMLLASGGELSARRGGNEVSLVSLTGFTAVSAYLRWIAARQDYSVLPRGWPVPNGTAGDTAAAVTQVGNWASPMPQPQAIQTTAIPSQVQRAPLGSADNTDTEGLRAEINELRSLLMDRRSDKEQIAGSIQASPPVVVAVPPTVPAPATDQVIELMDTISMLQVDLARMKAAEGVVPPPQYSEDAPMVDRPTASETTAKRLQFLMEDLGLDMHTAVAVLQMSPQSNPMIDYGAVTSPPPAQQVESPPGAGTKVLYQTDVVDQILAELEADIAQPNVPMAPVADASRPTIQEYQLLSRYFTSVALPALRKLADDE